MNQNRQLRVAILWLVLVVGMILHSTYALSALRYGEDVSVANATGSVPWSNVWLKTTFYVVPLIMSVVTLLSATPSWRWFNFAASVAFLLANIAHVAAEGFRAFEPLPIAQSILLACLAASSVPLTVLSWRWAKERN